MTDTERTAGAGRTRASEAGIARWALIVAIAISAAIRFRLLDVPLERDEGEYAYGALMIRDGLLPYVDFYGMRLPGVYLAYAGLISIFGPTAAGIHLGLLAVNVATIVLLYRLATDLADRLAGVAAAACFAAISLAPSVNGVSANTEHFVILPAVAGTWLLVKALREDRARLYFGAGLLFGIGVLMKQHGAAFVAFAGAALFVDRFAERSGARRALAVPALLLAAGSALPYAATALFFFAAGAFEPFWFWTVTYPSSYVTQVPASQAWQNFSFEAGRILAETWPLWTLVGLGALALRRHERARRWWALLLLWFAFSFASICPGFVFRGHYFILLLPAAAVLAGIGVSAAASALRLPEHRRFAVGCVAVAVLCAATLFVQRAFLFRANPFAASRVMFGRNPFPESVEIAAYIRAHTDGDDRIAVLGSEAQILFHSGRRSATGFLDTYPLMESHPNALAMQEQMIREIEDADPAYIVHVDPAAIPWSWLRQRYSSDRIFQWFRTYRTRYERVGIVEIDWLTAEFRWGADAHGPPKKQQWVEILKRRTP